MRSHSLLRIAGLATAGLFALALAPSVLATGPDVVWTSIGDTTHYGPVNGIHAYALGTHTCNIGNQNLHWGGTYGGTPIGAMNAYRLHDGRLLQIGLGFGKRACCAAAGSGCGISCNGQGGSVLGSGCLDVYSSGYNGGFSQLGPRSGVNAFTGAMTLGSGVSGDAIFRRLQIPQSDITAANFPNALYFVDGIYVGTDDAQSGNAYNNATYQRVTFTAAYAMTLMGSPAAWHPAIEAWHDHGLGVGIPDPSVIISNVDVPSEGRFVLANKVRDLGNGTWRYDYAIYNINSDRSGGTLSIPLPAGATITNAGFHDVNYHSGEPYDNTDWTMNVTPTAITWSSPQAFAQNPNSNALRWGTMYNFWFDANMPPGNGQGTLGLFKPHTPQSVTFAAAVPQAPVAAGDMNCDGSVNNFDVDPFVLGLTNPAGYAAQFPSCNINNGDLNNDGALNNFDIDAFVALLTP
jgi:hypothetical protein